MRPAARDETGEGSPKLTRIGMRIAAACERYFPDAFVFALAAVLVVLCSGLVLGEAPLKLVSEIGHGFWVLVPLTMQMALVIIGGFVVASSPPLTRLIRFLAGIPRTARVAVAFVALFSMLASLVSWGLSLVFTGLLVREVVQRVRGIDYRAIGAAAYLGLGSVWALGLSSSAASLHRGIRTSFPEGALVGVFVRGCVMRGEGSRPPPGPCGQPPGPRTVEKAVPATTGVLIQFPFYGGVSASSPIPPSPPAWPTCSRA